MKEIYQKREIYDIVAQQKEFKKAREGVAHLKNKKVFIISGSHNVRMEIKSNLETLGFLPKNILSSNSPVELISKIKQKVYDIDFVICHQKILDARTSHQTGVQLLEIIKNMLLDVRASKTIPFIFMETSFEKSEIVSAIRAGASQILILPSDPTTLGKKLIDIFQKPENFAVSKEVIMLLFEANSLRNQGLFEKAINIYNQALEIAGENANVLTEKANALFEMGNINQAIQLFKRVIKLEAKYPRAYQGLGMAYELLGNIEEGKKNYLKVLEFEPDNVQIYYNIGVIYRKERNYDKAKDYFEKGIELNKNFIKNYLGLAMNYEEQGDPIKALEIYKQTLKNDPMQTYILITAGDLCLKHNLFQEAEELFSSAIDIDESHIHIYNRLGIVLRKQKKFDKAVKNYAKAIKIKPDDANLYYNQAKAFFFKGDKLKAIDTLNKAFNLDPDLKSYFEKDISISKLLVMYPDKFEI